MNGNGTMAWRMTQAEKRLDTKAALTDVQRIETKVDRLTAIAFWVLLTLITATVSLSATAIAIVTSS